MTPYELAKWIHRELSPQAPRLSAAINRALVDIGAGSPLVGLGPGSHENDTVTFQASETLTVARDQIPAVLAKIQEIAGVLEEHSRWQAIIDKKPGKPGQPLELLYTLVRSR